MAELNGYELSRSWFDWAFENPEKVSPAHTAIYFYAIETCNRLGWPERFGLPTMYAMTAVGIKKPHTYIQYFRDLVQWGFLELVEESKNQHTSNIISFKSAMPKNGGAHGRAHGRAQGEASGKHAAEHRVYNKTNNLITNNHKTEADELFAQFWGSYGKKTDKAKTHKQWMKLTIEEMQEIIKRVPAYVQSTPDLKYRKNPLTYLNGRCWEDEIHEINETQEPVRKFNHVIPPELNVW